MGRSRPFSFAVTVLAVLLSACTSTKGAAASESPPAREEVPSFGVDDLLSDFDYLSDTLLSVNPLVNAEKAGLASFIGTQRAIVRDGMSGLEFFRILSPIVTKAGCGHSSLSLSLEMDRSVRATGRYLPFLFRVVGGRLFVVSSLGAGRPEAGSEVIAINGKTSKEILSILLDNITADGRNLTKKYYIASAFFNDLYRLFIASTDRYVLDFLDHSGSGRVVVEGISKDDLDSAESVSGVTASSLRGPDLDSSFDSNGIAYLRVRNFNYYDTGSLGTFTAYIDGFFKALAARGCGSLILDLRDNWGGDPRASSSLFSYLIREPAPYFSADVPDYPRLTRPVVPADDAFVRTTYVLINGASFSSTGHLCSLLKFHTRAIFIGEESGGSWSCTDASSNFILPNTGIVLRSSTREYTTAVTGFERGRGIVPDFPLTPTIEDILRGTDPVRDFAVELAGR